MTDLSAQRLTISALFAALTLLGSGALAQAPVQDSPGDTPSVNYAAPHQLVPVSDKRRLNLFCLGTGSPVVILDAGAGGDITSWLRVQARIAAWTRVCSYDRAGYGFSDPNDRPSTAANIVDDLHRLLETAGIPRPVVLIGHSAGGLYATIYAGVYRKDVAGMVLVDPSFADQAKQLHAIETPQERAAEKADMDATVARQKGCAAWARAGAERAKSDTCGRVGPGLPPALTARLVEYLAQPKFYEAWVAEMTAFNNIENELADEGWKDRPFGAMPLIVLTAGNSATIPFLSAETNAKYVAIWKAGHDQLAARSSLGKSVVVPDSGHAIQFAQPGTVVDAVREVVEAARAK